MEPSSDDACRRNTTAGFGGAGGVGDTIDAASGDRMQVSTIAGLSDPDTEVPGADVGV
jgi:hypothetical protein